MDKRYEDIAKVIRKTRDATRDFETRVTINNLIRDLQDLYMDEDTDFPIREFGETAGLYLPLLSDIWKGEDF